MKNQTKRVTVLIDEDMNEIFEIIKKISKDKNIVGKLSRCLLKERFYFFLDEVDCDLSFIDKDVYHMTTRTDCGIYTKQFKQAISINRNKLKKEDKNV